MRTRSSFIVGATLFITQAILLAACGSDSEPTARGLNDASSASGGSGGTIGKEGTGGSPPLSTGGAGGTDSQPIDGGGRTVAIVQVEMTWANSADAGATVYRASAKPDGNVTCMVYDHAIWRVVGESAQPDQKIQSLLAQPDVDAALATPCLLNMADVDSPVVTTLTDGSQVQHLVFGSCATAGLNELTAAVHDVCGGMTIVLTDPDGGGIASPALDAPAVDVPSVDGSTIDTSVCSCSGG